METKKSRFGKKNFDLRSDFRIIIILSSKIEVTTRAKHFHSVRASRPVTFGDLRGDNYSEW